MSTTIALGDIVAKPILLDPSKFADETFDLYSIPAFDRGEPDVIGGSKIGSSKQLVEPGDVLLSKIVPHIRRSWIVGEDRGRRMIASGEWMVFRTGRVHPGYLRHVLLGDRFHLQFMNTVAGVGGSLLRARPAHVGAITIPLPSLPEQRRIAEVLDRAEALRAKRGAALAQVDTLTQSIFIDMFGDPETNPKKWPRRSVSEYVASFQGGKSLAAAPDDQTASRNRILKISAVTGMRFVSSENKPVPDSYRPPIDHFVRPGDLLFSRANTSELVGAVAFVDSCPKNLLLPDKLWRFVWKAPSLVEPLFIWFLFQTPAIRREIARRATGTSGSMKNISQAKVLGMSTIVPPLEEQREFCRRLTAVRRLRDLNESARSELDALFLSLQHRAFRGEL